MTTLTPEQLIEIGTHLQQVGRFIPRTLPAGLVDNGQCDEVTLLKKYLPQETGYYVDIGAGDPESCSNTWKFYQQGWNGLLIEPYPGFWHRLLRLRPRDHLIPYACSDEDGYARLRICGTCSSIRPDWSIVEQSELMVETAKLSTILKDFPEIEANCNLCSIDVEGLEKQVLEGIDWDTFHPDVFCVEYLRFAPDKPREDLSVEWESILLEHGYVRRETTPLNYIYTEPPPPEVMIEEEIL
jgi:FkbM family methyltransferase